MRSSSPRFRIAAAAGLAVTAAFLAPRIAEASSTFPAAVQTHLSLGSPPSCSICHEGGHTGMGTVTTPFGAALRARGLVAGDVASLNAALDQLASDAVDSNGDGVTDIDALKAGTDPNGGNGGPVNAPAIQYGCGGAHVAGSTSGSGWLGAATLLGVVAGLGLRRRRRSAGGLAIAIVATSALVAGCYDVSYVSSSQCASGAMWTGVGEGSTMKPGAACIYCHTHEDGPKYTLAGTVFVKSNEKDNCVGSNTARIIVQGADGKAVELVPNEVGNFFTRLNVAFPYRAKVVMPDGRESVMATPQSDGDCNACHSSTGANGAPGRVTVP